MDPEMTPYCSQGSDVTMIQMAAQAIQISMAPGKQTQVFDQTEVILMAFGGY